MSNLITIGVDIGQKRSPTAICVAEVDDRRIGGRTVNHWVVRHLERLPLGTSYPEIARRLSEVSGSVRQRNACRPFIYVDATGLGEPIIDLLHDETTDFDSITAVYFSHGDRRTKEGQCIRLGKAYLVSKLQTLLQTSCLHLPQTAGSEQLAKKLLDYEIRVDEQANDRYGAFRVGSNDDLVTALGLAVNKEPGRIQVSY